MTVPDNLMGLPGYVPPPVIPKCDLVVRRGEAPAKDFSNVFNWTPELAKRPLEFEPLEVGPTPKDGDPDVAAMRRVQLIDDIKNLLPEDFTAAGPPRMETIRAKSKLENLTFEEVRSAWEEI